MMEWSGLKEMIKLLDREGKKRGEAGTLGSYTRNAFISGFPLAIERRGSITIATHGFPAEEDMLMGRLERRTNDPQRVATVWNGEMGKKGPSAGG
jgi:hypothetical protein